MKEVTQVALESSSDEIDVVMEKFTFWKALPVIFLALRLIHTCRAAKKTKRTGPL